MSSSVRPHELQPARLLCPWDSPGKDTGRGCCALPQRIFPTQGSNLGLLRLLLRQAGSLPLLPLCCMAESSTTVYINYASIKCILKSVQKHFFKKTKEQPMFYPGLPSSLSHCRGQAYLSCLQPLVISFRGLYFQLLQGKCRLFPGALPSYDVGSGTWKF